MLLSIRIVSIEAAAKPRTLLTHFFGLGVADTRRADLPGYPEFPFRRIEFCSSHLIKSVETQLKIV